ncbi:MAG: TIGR03936 family radical SAM-associated protein [Thermoguttaceae bacterium]|nr:TIGR03936 family radical SAM-associated protein [Thermoguttaceae bacterium]
MVRRRYRLRFCKRGNLCFIGHRDLLRAMERILRRAELPVAKSQGFHPKPRVSYLSALPLGFSSDDEAMELILEEDWPSETLLSRLNNASVDGLEFLRAVPLEEGAPKQQALAFSYVMTVPEELAADVREKIAAFLAADSYEVEKSNGKIIDARPPVKALSLEGSTLRLVLAAQTGPEAGVREILVCLGLADRLFRSIFPNRDRCYIVDEEQGA